VNLVPIVIEPEAKSDIRAARDYYSDKGDHTSERFRDELTHVFNLLSRHP
jgi:plasmid stabilization system protein ParE